jgi:hypothetical protein
VREVIDETRDEAASVRLTETRRAGGGRESGADAADRVDEKYLIVLRRHLDDFGLMERAEFEKAAHLHA